MTESGGSTRNDIYRLASLLTADGNVAEIRVLKAPGTWVGYTDSPDVFVRMAEQFNGKAPGIYATLNPVDPGLRPRAEVQLSRTAKTASDRDIIRRRLILIDFDPRRPAGTSSSDTEHEAAIAAAGNCAAFLREKGFPEPLLADSGNGAHLLYRVDLPNDHDSSNLVRDFLVTLSLRFSTEQVELDTKTFNAARISKVYGTTAKKGDATEDRPHRMSRILEMPDELQVVTENQLRKITESTPQFSRMQKSFEVDDFISRHGLEISRVADWNGGKKWVLKVCPFNPEHRDSAGYIVRLANGAIGAGCHHSSCSGKGWAELREACGEPSAHAGQYQMDESGIVRHKLTQDGFTVEHLTNFSAQIVAEIRADDGAEVTKTFEVVAKVRGREHRFQVSAAEFGSLNWAIRELGSTAVIYAGMSAREHARVAIQLHSGDVPIREIFTHLGWREINGTNVFLHGGGAIGAEGEVDEVQVDLCRSPLGAFRLPAPPDDPVPQIRASLRFLEIVEFELAVPVYAAIWRAVLGNVDFTLQLTGETGVGKSEIAALAQQHFGASLDARHLPGSWLSTENALEAQMFSAKDVLFVVDDFAPNGTLSDLAQWYRKADRLIRGQGNSSGRQRMRQDTSLRPVKRARCLIISTGEATPRGHSVLARMLVVEVEKEQVNWAAITDVQKAAAEGQFAAATSAFIRWLAPDFKQRQEEMRNRALRYRELASASGQHKRTPHIVAQLAAGLDVFLEFALSQKVMDETQKAGLARKAWSALLNVANGQMKLHTEEDPVTRALELLDGGLASGRAYLSPIPEAGLNVRGMLVGWMEDGSIYLEPQSAYSFIQKTAREQSGPLPLGEKALWKRFRERGLIARTDQQRNQFTWKGRRVLAIKTEALPSATPAPWPEDDPLGPQDGKDKGTEDPGDEHS